MSRVLSNIDITNGVERVSLVSPASIPGNYNIMFPTTSGTAAQILKIQSGVLAFSDKTFPDNKFEIYDNLTPASRMSFSATNLASNTRTFTPVSSGDGVLPLRNPISRNILLGENLYALASANDITSLGNENSTTLTTGTSNTSIGSKSMKLSNSTGVTSIGYNALAGLLSGDGNTTLGASSLQSSVSSSNNISVGTNSMSLGNASGIDNIAIGASSLRDITTGNRNISIGRESLRLCTTDSDNISLGHRSLYSFNNNTSGSTSNISIGESELFSLVSGSNNIAVSSVSGGQAITSGTNNIILGGYNNLTSLNNTIAIDPLNAVKCTIAGISSQTSSGGTDVYITGGVAPTLGTIPSTIRKKNTVTPIDVTTSSKLYDVEIVSFYYNDDDTHRIQYGMIAEELVHVYPENVVFDQDGITPYAIMYNQFLALMIAELKRIKITSLSIENIAAGM